MDKNFSIKTIKEDNIFVAIYMSAKRKHSSRDLLCLFVSLLQERNGGNFGK